MGAQSACRLAGRFGRIYRREERRSIRGLQGEYELASGAVE